MSNRKLLFLFIFVLILGIITGVGLYKTGTHNTTKSVVTTTVPLPPHGETARTTSECPYTYVSWNIANLGKHNTPEQFAMMAKILAHADIVAVQEVTARKGFGAKAVAQLADELSRTGSDWDYIVSDATEPASTGVERYAFLWKKHVISINRDNAHLVQELRDPIDREPFSIVFHLKGGTDLAAFTIHAIPTAKNPITEVQALVKAKEILAIDRALVSGDFNLGASDTDEPFRTAGYEGHIRGLTSIKSVLKDGQHLAKQYDNIYTKGVNVCTAGVIDFVKEHFSPLTPASLRNAREVSDHIPVFATFK